MTETLQANRLAIFARHALTPANRAKYEGSAESSIQGLSPNMSIDGAEGALQSHALGIALGSFIVRHHLEVVEVHSSNTRRTKTTRDLALEHVPGLPVVPLSQELWEIRKGIRKKGGLEGMLRSEAYPDEATRHAAATDWDFRHGTIESGGQTARETGEQWLRWFNRVSQQPNFQPNTDPELPIPTILVFGHNLITASGITLLNHDGESPLPPVSDRTFRVANATGLFLAENDGEWSVLTERLVPTTAEIEEARAYM